MKAKNVLSFLVLFVFTFGSSSLLRSAELVDFQKKVEKYKNAMGANELVMADMNKARQSVIKAETSKEKSEAYASLTKHIAETLINYKKAEKALDDVLADLRGGINLEDKGGSLEVELTNYIGDIDSVFDEMEATILNMDSNTDISGDLNETIKETKALFLDMFQNAKKGKKDLIKLLDGKGSGENAIQDLQKTFEYAKTMISFSRQMYTIDFKVTAAVGKVTGLQEKIADLMEAHGMPDKIIEGIHEDQYEEAYMNLIMLKDLLEIGTKSEFMSKEFQKELQKKIKEMNSMPKPGSIKDDDPAHAYFCDMKKMRWFWVNKDKPRGERHYAPFDYEAGTGLYIKYKDGKWYSFAPIYNGQEVEIFPDLPEGQKEGE